MEEQPDKRLENLEELHGLLGKLLEKAKESPEILQSRPTEVALFLHPSPSDRGMRPRTASLVATVGKALDRVAWLEVAE